MAYPNDIDDFPEYEDRDLAQGKEGTLIVNQMFQVIQDAVVIIETILGTLPQGSDPTVRERLEAIEAEKLNLSGGTMSGALVMGSNPITGIDYLRLLALTQTTIARFTGSQENAMLEIKNDKVATPSYAKLKLRGLNGVVYLELAAGGNPEATSITSSSGHPIYIASLGSSALNINADGTIDIFARLQIASDEDIEVSGNGRGVIVKTPDGTKRYKISVDNAGNIISTLQ